MMKEKLQMKQWWLAIFAVPVLFAGILLAGVGCEESMVEEPVEMPDEEEPAAPEDEGSMEETEEDTEFDVE